MLSNAHMISKFKCIEENLIDEDTWCFEVLCMSCALFWSLILFTFLSLLFGVILLVESVTYCVQLNQFIAINIPSKLYITRMKNCNCFVFM
jgi:hypothetical protein